MPRQCEAGNLRERIAVAPQDVVALDEVFHVEILPVGAERDAFREAAYISLRHLAYCLSLYLEQRHVGFLMPVEVGLGSAAGAVQDQRGGITAGRADGEPLWTIADDYLIDDPGRACLEVDDAHGVDLAVLAAADVVDDRELAVGRDLDVDRVEAGGYVVVLAFDPGVADLLAVDVEQCHPVGAAFD